MLPADIHATSGFAGNFVLVASSVAKSSGTPANYFPHVNLQEKQEILVVL